MKLSRLHARFLAASVAFFIAQLLANVEAQAPSRTLDEVAALRAGGDKGAAQARLASQLNRLIPGDPNADALLEFAFEASRYSPGVRANAIAATTAAQALRMASAAQGVKPLWLERDLREAWRAKGGAGAAPTLRLAQLRALVGSTDDEAVKLLDEVLGEESGATSQDRAAAQVLRGALAGPRSMEELEAAWGVWRGRIEARAAHDRVRAAARVCASSASKDFYAAFLKAGSAHDVAEAERMTIEALLSLKRPVEARAVCERVVSRKGANADDLAHAAFHAAEALAMTRDWSGAADQFWDFIAAYPEDDRVSDALYAIGDAMANAHERPLALAAFDLVIDIYPASNAARNARERVRQWSGRPDYEELKSASRIAFAGVPSGPNRLAAISQLREFKVAEAILAEEAAKTAHAAR